MAINVVFDPNYYVNRFNYADTFLTLKSDNLSVCTILAVEKHRFPSSGHFFCFVNYGNRFVTIFRHLKTFTFPYFYGKPPISADFS